MLISGPGLYLAGGFCGWSLSGLALEGSSQLPCQVDHHGFEPGKPSTTVATSGRDSLVEPSQLSAVSVVIINECFKPWVPGGG